MLLMNGTHPSKIDIYLAGAVARNYEVHNKRSLVQLLIATPLPRWPDKQMLDIEA